MYTQQKFIPKNNTRQIKETFLGEIKTVDATLTRRLQSEITERFCPDVLTSHYIVVMFMGAYNACKIQQLKLKFNNLHSEHNMLVRVANQCEEGIKNIVDNMQSIMEVIDLMVEYNPGLLMMQIGEQLYKFRDRVTAKMQDSRILILRVFFG
jgi:hypothetical protein